MGPDNFCILMCATIMKVFCGSFAALESRFCDALGASTEKTLVVAPSGRLLERLERALLERRGCVANVELRTFMGLASLLAAELPGGRPFLGDPAYYDFALKTVLQERGELSLTAARGCVSAVRSAVRDAADACIDPALILQNLEGGEFRKKSEAERVSWLLRLQASYLERLEQLPVMPHYSLFRTAAAQAVDSPSLREYDSVVFYGFYDLTGLQYELLRAVSKAARQASLYFPLLKHPAYDFAKRFYESNIAGLSSETQWLEEDWKGCAIGGAAQALFNPGGANGASVRDDSFSVATASGRADELWFAAKEILRLVENEGYAWQDICVTARSFEPYLPQLRQVFLEQRVPVADRISLPLAAHPLSRWALALLTAEESGFSAERLREIISSPYFCRSGESAAWLRVSAGLGTVSGAEKICAALRAFSGGDETLKNAALSLADWMQKLRGQLLSLSAPGQWTSLCDGALAVLDGQLDAQAVSSEDAAALEEFKNCVESLRRLADLRPAAEKEFLEELCARFGSAGLKIGPRAENGIRLLDAMAVRGHSFRAVIMLGLNEKIFPRVVREDPILRDEHRRFLRDAGGFWIMPKLEGYEEERLLFHMLAASARQRLVCVCCRSDEEGKAAVPSLYLEELCAAAGFSLRDAKRVRSVPRRFADKIALCDSASLSESEISTALSLLGPQEGYAGAGLETEFFSWCRQKAQTLGSGVKASAYDGLCGPLSGFSEGVDERGFSPSALESLLGCPMQYFLHYALGLDSPGSPLDPGGLAADIKGRLYHEALRGLYEHMAHIGGDCSAAEARGFLGRYFNSALHGAYGLYPLVWKSLAADMTERILKLLEADKLSRGNYRPAFFERAGEAQSRCGFQVHGRMDRIDVNEAENAVRVVDYKTSIENRPSKPEKLISSGKIFQPFIYLELANALFAKENLKAREAVFIGLQDDPGKDGALPVQAFTAADFEVSAQEVCRVAQVLAGLVRKGEFFIQPDLGEMKRCSWCAYGGVCRNRHALGVARAEAEAEACGLQTDAQGGEDGIG